MPEKPHLLCVDDEPLVLASLRRSLGPLLAEMDFTGCGSGAEAIRLLETNSVDVLVTDLRMPPPNGLDVLLCASKASPSPLRFIYSAYHPSALPFEMVCLPHGYYLKPLSPLLLAQAIRSAFDARGSISPGPVRDAIVGLSSLPVLPETLRSLEADVRNQALSADRLAAMSHKDPAFAANLLHLAFSMSQDPGRRFKGVLESARSLDIPELHLTLKRGLPAALDESSGIAREWRSLHAHACQIAGRLIADCPAESTDEYISTGLLHDVGRQCLLHMKPDARVPEQANPSAHAAISAALLRLWGAAPSVVEAVAGQHQSPVSGNPLASALYAANHENEKEHTHEFST